MDRLQYWLSWHGPLVMLLLTAGTLFLGALFVFLERRSKALGRSPRARLDVSGLITLAALSAIWSAFLLTEYNSVSCRLGDPVVRLGSVWVVGSRPYTALLLGGAVVWVLTSVVDLLNWRQIVALPALLLGARVALGCGLAVSVVKVPFITDLVALDWAGPVLTVLWLVLCSTVFGWSAALLELPFGVAGLASLTCAGIFALLPATLRGQYPVPHVALTLALVLLLQAPFASRLSRRSARAGAMTVGFLVGGLSIMGALKETAFLVALLPLLLVGIPIFSVTYTYVADLRHGGRAVAVQERRRNLDVLLLAQGYSRRQVVALLLAGSAYLCALALLLVALIEISFVVKTLVLVVGLAAGGVGFYVLLRLLPRAKRSERADVVPPGAGQNSPLRETAETAEPEEVWLLGVRLHAVTYPGALAAVAQFLREGHPHMVITSDASAVIRAQDDAEFREIMNAADLVTADGAGVVLASKLLDLPLQDKVSGCDLVTDLCAVATAQQRGVYLLGAEPGVAEAAARVLAERVPGLQVVGCRDGYFDEAEEQRIVADIQSQQPGLLLVAMGIPRQEKWIKAHLEALGVPVCIGVGGSLDVISGRKRRAPVWMQRCGLEWLYRTAKEPKRLPRLAALPRIVLLTFRELLRR
ncbi:MAG TPA: WecB/TagA/CpsF family glycosyltransferase [Armatimonadota bacterium]|jgi:N-acetylglucosaminyldiphosphoundecaprenol N-acetyl-beta-D-mannosaminyltransferase